MIRQTSWNFDIGLGKQGSGLKKGNHAGNQLIMLWMVIDMNETCMYNVHGADFYR